MSNNIYNEANDIKQKLINLKENTINTNWFDYLTNLSDTDKANLIYEYLLLIC